MAHGRDAALVATGRVARGFLATAALGVLAFLALIGLTWSCCSTPSLSEKLGSPLVHGALASIPVALAAFPFVAKRLRRAKARWLLAPFVLDSLYFCVMVARGCGSKPARRVTSRPGLRRAVSSRRSSARST
jgi:hypothetical protein